MGVNSFFATVVVCICLTFSVAAGARAQQPPAPANDPTVACPVTLSATARIECFENLDKMLLEQLKVANDQKDLDADTGADDTSDKARGITIPNVLSIYGFGAQPLTAVLAYAENRSLTVHAGEEVPGGFHVDGIYSDPAKVVLSKDGSTYILLMGNGGPSINTTSTPNRGQNSFQPGAQINMIPPSQSLPGRTGGG